MQAVSASRQEEDDMRKMKESKELTDQIREQNILVGIQLYRDSIHLFSKNKMPEYTEENINLYLKFLQCLQHWNVSDFFSQQFV